MWIVPVQCYYWNCLFCFQYSTTVPFTRWLCYTGERTTDVFALVTASPIMQHWPLFCRQRTQALAGWTWFSWHRLGLWRPGIRGFDWSYTRTWAWSKAMGCPWTLGSNQPAPRCLNTPCTLCNLQDRNHLGWNCVVQQTKWREHFMWIIYLLSRNFDFSVYFGCLTTFFSGLNFTVVSHDLHHMTQAGAWNSVYGRRLWETAKIYGENKKVSWEVNNLLSNRNQETVSLHSKTFYVAYTHTWQQRSLCNTSTRNVCKDHAKIIITGSHLAYLIHWEKSRAAIVTNTVVWF